MSKNTRSKAESKRDKDKGEKDKVEITEKMDTDHVDDGKSWSTQIKGLMKLTNRFDFQGIRPQNPLINFLYIVTIYLYIVTIILSRSICFFSRSSMIFLSSKYSMV